jgi:hypothetical protein
MPPHFTVAASDPDIAQAMSICFGSLAETFNETAILLLLLASLILHIEFIRSYSRKSTRHPFNQLQILHYPDLIVRLQGNITSKKSNIIPQPTGIPRTLSLLKSLNK